MRKPCFFCRGGDTYQWLEIGWVCKRCVERKLREMQQIEREYWKRRGLA